MGMKDNFSVSMGMPMNPSREAPGAFPRTQATPGQGKSVQLRAKYDRFTVDPGGNKELEEIMTGCTTGLYTLAEEKWYFTKDGEAVVVIKYYIVEDEATANLAEGSKDIAGRRRARKALTRQEEP